MTAANLMLTAILAMGTLHFIMMVWLYVSRLWAMKLAGVTTSTATYATMRKLPNWALNPAANYNNLTEAPPLFYAVVIVIVLLERADPLYVALAWLYVALRLVHSLWQSLINIISVRMILFGVSWLVLAVMILRATLNLLAPAYP